jgi:hypothetical protein
MGLGIAMAEDDEEVEVNGPQDVAPEEELEEEPEEEEDEELEPVNDEDGGEILDTDSEGDA